MSTKKRQTKNVLLAVLLLGFLSGIQTVDPIIATVALVRAASSLHFTTAVTTLAASISTLALVATVIASGLVADRIGRRRLLMIALLLSIIGDVLVAISTGPSLYLLGRAIAGVGLGGVFSAAFAYVRTVSGGRIGAALGQFGAMGGLVTMFGGLVGGVLVTTNWRLAFLVVPVLCAVGFLLVPLLLPKETRIKSAPLDLPGLGLLAIATTGILYGLSHASASLTDTDTVLPIAVGLTALLLFVMVEQRAKHPVFPLKLFKNPVFLGAVLTVLVWNFAQAVIGLQLSNIWQYVEHYTPTAVTFGQLPLSVIAIASSIVAGRSLAKGKSPRSRILIGFSLMALGFLSLAVLPLGTGYLMYLPAIILIGFGLPFTTVTSGQLFMSEAPPKLFGPVTSSKTAIGQFGYALGLAGSMVVVSNLTNGGITKHLIKAGVPPSQTGQGLDAVTQYVNVGTQPHTQVGSQALHLASASYTQAFASAMLLAAAITAATGVIVYVLLVARHPKASAS